MGYQGSPEAFLDILQEVMEPVASGQQEVNAGIIDLEFGGKLYTLQISFFSREDDNV